MLLRHQSMRFEFFDRVTCHEKEEVLMGDYTNMSGYYDLIMTSGYYDYPKIVDALMTVEGFHSVLEIGCGTGLILEELAKRANGIEITGFDLTPAMLSIAQQRLASYAHVHLLNQNVTGLQLSSRFDLAFSYGGVWYFVMDEGQPLFMVSHIADHQANWDGLTRVAQHIQPGGQLLLGIQGPHHNYAAPISNGYVYSQTIDPSPHGFIKHYFLDDGDQRLMSQRIDYRTYAFDEALAMLASLGLHHQPSPEGDTSFVRFVKS